MFTFKPLCRIVFRELSLFMQFMLEIPDCFEHFSWTIKDIISVHL